MSKKKACKDCKAIMEASVDNCQICGSSSFTTVFQGRVCVLHPKDSYIAQRMNINDKGEFAVRTRG